MLDIIELKMSIMNQEGINQKDSQILSLIEALEEKTYKLQEASREVEICHNLMYQMERKLTISSSIQQYNISDKELEDLKSYCQEKVKSLEEAHEGLSKIFPALYKGPDQSHMRTKKCLEITLGVLNGEILNLPYRERATKAEQENVKLQKELSRRPNYEWFVELIRDHLGQADHVPPQHLAFQVKQLKHRKKGISNDQI